VVGIALIGAGLGGLLLTSLGVAGAGLTLVMAVLTLLFGAAAFYGYHEFDLYGGKGQQQTSDSDDALKGKTGTVTEVTTAGGEVKLSGGGFNPYYAARSIEGTIEEGEEVMVVDPGGGNVVTVESMGYVEDDIDKGAPPRTGRGRKRSERPMRAWTTSESPRLRPNGSDRDRDGDPVYKRLSDGNDPL